MNELGVLILVLVIWFAFWTCERKISKKEQHIEEAQKNEDKP